MRPKHSESCPEAVPVFARAVALGVEATKQKRRVLLIRAAELVRSSRSP